MSEIDKLNKQYEKLMKESFRLSKTNRAEGDKKYAEADAIGKRIEELNR